VAAHDVVQICWLNSRFIGDLDIRLDQDVEPHALAPLFAHRAHLVAHMSPELLRFADLPVFG
jgi:hypothetical protein